MAYGEDLLHEAGSENSAYIQYITGRGREGYAAYAFVEDDDDTVFFQHVLDDVEHLAFIGCGGKSGVLSVFRKTTEDGTADGQLFFVDRDTEVLPFDHADEVLRTAQYSWESHLCQNEVVIRFLQRKISPNLTKKECDEVGAAWESTIKGFSGLIAQHTALVKTSSEMSPTLGMRRVSLTKKCKKDGICVVPDLENVEASLSEKIGLALVYGVDEKIISDRVKYYLNTDPLETGKGKTIFQIFKEFALAVKVGLERSIIVDPSNISLVLASLSPNDQGLSYIRRYAANRLIAVK